MTKYISKDAVVAEIERRLKTLNKDRDFNYLQIKELEALLSSLDTIEVKEEITVHEAFKSGFEMGVLQATNKMKRNTKEVDLEKEIELIKGDYKQVDVAWNNDFDYIARHFFELGVKAQKGE